MLTNNIKYSFINNEKYKDTKKILKDTNKVEEYRVWYNGQINEILSFYKRNQDVRNYLDANLPDTYTAGSGMFTPSFLKLVPIGDSYNAGGYYQVNNFTVHHSPVANVISRVKAALIASTSPIVTIESDKVREQKMLQELCDMIFKENNFGTSFQKDIETCSYSGGVAYKPILDQEFSDIPLYQVYSKGSFLINTKYDKVVSIVFMDELVKDRKKYILYSEHGRGFVLYTLVEKSGSRVVPLSTLEETRDLQNLTYIDKTTGEPLDLLLGVYVENKPGFRSDYENVIDNFQAIDEIFSKYMDFLRKTTATRIVSESQLKTTIEGEVIIPPIYDANFLVRWNNSSAEANEVNELQALPDVQNPIMGYITAKNDNYEDISSSVGLSVKALASKDLSGANQSGDALAIRENVDFRTRENMVVIWSEALRKLFKLLLVLSTTEATESNMTVETLDDIDIQVEFYNPSTPTFEQEVEECARLLEAGLMDHYGVLERLWLDSGRKTEEEVKAMYQKIVNQEEKENQQMEQTKDDIMNGGEKPKDTEDPEEEPEDEEDEDNA